MHFVDSDAGSPPSRPFNLTQYENFLSDHGLLIAQPAIIKVLGVEEEQRGKEGIGKAPIHVLVLFHSMWSVDARRDLEDERG